MVEATKDVQVETKKAAEAVAKEEAVEKAPELSEVEVRASDQGWKPEKDWDGDPAEWRDARSFLDRGELLNRISTQNKEMKDLRRTLKTFEEHNKKLADTKFKEKLEELKGAKKLALEGGDAARVVDLDEQIDLVRDGMAEAKATSTVKDPEPDIHPDFQRWMDKNSWYGQNDEMRMFADNVGTAYAKSNRHKAPAEVLSYVEGRVKRAYSDQFTASREPVNKVETGGGNRRIAGKREEEVELPEDARQVMETLVKGGHMTKADYIKQWKLMK